MKRLPRWLWVLLVFVVLVVVLALVVPQFLDVDRYRTLIASAIEKETGRKVSIGQIRARLLPSVGFTIEGFSLSNPPGFGEGNFLTAEEIRGSLAWRPLFRREIQLSSIEVVRPNLVLLENDRGQVNYDIERPKKPAGAPSGMAFRVADIDSIDLSEVELTLGRVTGSRRKILPALRVRQMNATLSDVALDAKRLKQWKADADLAGVRVDLTGLKGSIEFKSGDFELRDGAIDSKFEMAIGQISRMKGTVKVADIEKGVVTFTLSTPLLDLDQLPTAAGAETAPSTPSRPAKSELLAQGKLTADRIRRTPYEATGVSADVRIFTDRLEIWPISLGLYGGTLGVSARVDRRQSPERFSANIQVRNLDVAKVMAAAPKTSGKMTGTAELTLQVFGSLGKDLLNSLTGNGNFAVRDGKFPGFDMSGAAQTLMKVQKVLTLGGTSGGFRGDTTFRSITGDLAIAGARVRSERIHVDSPSGTVDMRGSFGFDQTLNYDGQAVLIRESSPGGSRNPAGAIVGVFGTVMKQTVGRISLPFAVRGTFSDPKIQPGRGLPGAQTSSPSPPAEEQPQQQQQQKKKSIFDVFRRP